MKFTIFLTVLVFILAFVLRFLFLGNYPNGLAFSEATLGWRDQNLINYGKDEYGRAFPFIFSNWKDLELPIPSYLTLPFVAYDMTNITLLRTFYALSGFLAVIGAYFLSKKLFPEQKNLSLAVAFIMAINPWGIWLSRFVNPYIVSLNLVIWGMYFLLFKSKVFLIGVILLILAILSSKISIYFLVPMLLFMMLKKDYKSRFFLGGLILLSLFTLIVLYSFGGTNTFFNNELSIFKNSDILSNLNLIRGQEIKAHLPSFLGGIFYNKLIFVIYIIGNFLTYFNPGYLFGYGDKNSFHNLSNVGLFLFTLFPVFLLGLYKFIGQKKELNFYSKESWKFILIWFLCSTIPAIFAKDSPRSDLFIFGIFPLAIFIGWGFINLKRGLIYLFLILAFVNLSFVIFDAVAKENIRSELVWHPETIDLAKYYLRNMDGQIGWMTDRVDPNPGPTLAYVLQKPYTATNLKDSSSNIYHGWVSKFDYLEIGNSQGLKKNVMKYSNLILSDEDQKLLNCDDSKLVNQIKVADKDLLIFKECYEEKI